MESVRIQNLRSLSDTKAVELRTINLLVGANSSGKSTFLKFFPLLRQSVEVPNASGLLLVGGRADLGTFNEAVRKGAASEEISFEMVTQIEAAPMPPYYYRVYYGYAGLLEPLKTTVRISFAKRPNSLKTFVPRISLAFNSDTLQIESNADGGVTKVIVNGMDFSEHSSALQLQSGRGVIPVLTYSKGFAPGDAIGVAAQRPENRSWLSSQMVKATGDVFDKRTQVSTKLEILQSVGIGSPELMLNQMGNVTENAGWLKMVKKANVSQTAFVELRNMILADRLRFLLLQVDEAISTFARTIRSVAPVRASADRYVRNQELAVDEMDADGRNLPMFLSNLTKPEQDAFCEWTQKNIGFAVRVEGDVHLSLKLTEAEAGSSFNLADTGFGFSQILPILVQSWLLTQISGNGGAGSRALSRNRRPTEPPSEYTIVIEQPELHLHPALQARLVDILIRTAAVAKNGGVTVHFFLETHSETIVNRVGFRISRGDLAVGSAQVLLFERKFSEDKFLASTIRRANYNQNGVLEDWPFGFFLPEEEEPASPELKFESKTEPTAAT